MMGAGISARERRRRRRSTLLGAGLVVAGVASFTAGLLLAWWVR